MRDELENGGPGSGGPPAVPPWAPPGPRVPPGAPADRSLAGQEGASAGSAQPRTPYLPRATGRGPGRARRVLLVIGLAVGLAALVVSAGAAALQFLPRSFSQAQRQQIASWEIAKRWRSWPAGRIFPPAIDYYLPGATFGGGRSLALQAERVGIAEQASCRDATDQAVGPELARRGCVAVLRATYQDATQTFAVTVGVAVMPASSAARASALLQPPRRPAAVAAGRVVPPHHDGPFRRAGSRRLGWSSATGPYLVLATVGYADGRPWLSQGHDIYTGDEMRGLASGVTRSVVSRLGAAPPVPHCPGSPGC